ncbi:hypothetical protein B0A49_14053, partial [Cryomyces minteri]
MPHTEHFSILQYNVNKMKSAQMALFEEEAVKEYDIIAIQEPWPGVGGNHYSTYVPHKELWHMVHLQEKGTRVALYVNAAIDKTSWEEFKPTKDLCGIIIRTKILG